MRAALQFSVHDEGSCWVPAVLRPAIILSHFGRTELDHVSTTGYWPDNYSIPTYHAVWQPEGFPGDKLGRFACFDPKKDLVVPPMASPNKYHAAPLFGAPTQERTTLAFFKGRLLMHNPPYSRGIRQNLTVYAREPLFLCVGCIFTVIAVLPGSPNNPPAVLLWYYLLTYEAC